MSARSVFALVLAVMATGCTNTISINVDDSTDFKQLAGSIPLGEDSATRLRLRWAEASGEDDQWLDTGEHIRLGSTDISGPTLVDIDLDLAYYSLAIGGEAEVDDRLKLITYLGISQTDFDFTLTGSGIRTDHSDRTTELYIQAGFARGVSESLDVGLTAAFSLGRDFSGMREIDLTLDYELLHGLVLSGGYRWFKYEYTIVDGDSNLEVDFRGPFIGLYLPF